ncbi:MAG: hypothetical protein J6Z40_04590 [Oscillospiraceae bacterium]|nr:hypothetical protein [Oscillospiraceae bacterium]
MQCKKHLPLLLTLLLIGGMTAAAEYLHNREIIFPEIAAIAAGALLTPKRAWNTDSKRIFLSISVCAVLGVLISRLCPFGTAPQMCLAFLIAQLLFFYSRTTFAPMISAIVLPVLLHTESSVYIAAAIILTALILLCRKLLIRLHILSDTPFEKLPVPDQNAYRNLLRGTVIGCGWILLSQTMHLPFLAAPPLLVAFTEFRKPDAVSRREPLRVILLLTACAASGALLRILLCVRLGAPLWLSAMLTMLAVYALMQGFRLTIPPAAAIAVLSDLVPQEALPHFPAQIACGIAGLVLLSFAFRRNDSTRPVPLHHQTAA